MKEIIYQIGSKEDTPTSALERYAGTVESALGDYYENAEVTKVRGTIKDTVDYHILAKLRNIEYNLVIELATDRVLEERLTIDGIMQECVRSVESSGYFERLLKPYLEPSQHDLDILLRQEAELQFESFTSQDALHLVQAIAEQAPQDVAVTVVRGDNQAVIAQYIGDHKATRNIMIAGGKRMMSLACEHSSLYAYCANRISGAYEEYRVKAPEYICGAGSVPIVVHGKRVATVSVSGVKEGMDHDLIIAALNNMLNKSVPDCPCVIF